MLKKSILLFAFIFSICYSYAQSKKHRSGDIHKAKLIGNSYNQKDTTLINNLIRLRYDSVKVFHFNCSKFDWINDIGYKVDSSQLYYKKRIEHPFYNDGKLLRDRDITHLLGVFKNSYLDIFKGDPVGGFIPTLGYAFFKHGVVCAHIDVSLPTDRVEIEIFKKGSSSFQYNYITLGQSMRAFLEPQCKKYNLQCCD